MARKVKYTEALEVTYLPDVDNGDIPNRKDPEPFEVDLIPMSGHQYAIAESEAGLGKISGGKKGSKIDTRARTRKLFKKIFIDNVVAVRGYTAVKNGVVITPTDGASLYDAIMHADEAESELIDEIVDAIRDASVLEEGRKKASAPSSESSQSQGTPHSLGVAPSASLKVG